MHWCLNSLYQIKWNLGVCDMIELCNDKEKNGKNVEFRRKLLITSSRARRKKTSSNSSSNSNNSSINSWRSGCSGSSKNGMWKSLALNSNKNNRSKKCVIKLGKSTRNILMHCAEDRVQMLCCAVSGSTLNFGERQQRTHIKSRGVLLLICCEIKTTSNWTASNRNIYQVNEYRTHIRWTW